ncbi:MAG: hypothetical protein KGJ69_12385, partial [Thermoplasmata archaeon]|nr:hypothetical protein [Thermoplasmata archaeon]
PLMLTIIALVNYRGMKLPDRRIELYQIATETLLENWPLRHRELRLDSKAVTQLLEPVAWEMVGRGHSQLPEHEVLDILSRSLAARDGLPPQKAILEATHVLETINLHTGFLMERGRVLGEPVFSFLHPTFGEYLAGRRLTEVWAQDGSASLKDKVHESRWHESFLLAAGYLGLYSQVHASNFVRAIVALDSPFRSVVNRDLLLAAEMLCDKVDVSIEVRNEVVANLVRDALTAKNEWIWYVLSGRIHRLLGVIRPGHVPELDDDPIGDSLQDKIRHSALSCFAYPDDIARKVALLALLVRQAQMGTSIPTELFRLFEQRRMRTGAVLLVFERNVAYPFEVPNEVAAAIKARLAGVRRLTDLMSGQQEFPSSTFDFVVVDADDLRSVHAIEYLHLLVEHGTRWPSPPRVLEMALGKDSMRSEAARLQAELVALANPPADTSSMAEILLGLTALADGRERSPLPSALELGKTALRSDNARVRAGALRFLLNSEREPDGICDLFEIGIGDADREVRLVPAKELERLDEVPNQKILDIAGRLLRDADLSVAREAALGMATLERAPETLIANGLEILEAWREAGGSDSADWLDRVLEGIEGLAMGCSEPAACDRAASACAELIRLHPNYQLDDSPPWTYLWARRPGSNASRSFADSVKAILSSPDSRIRAWAASALFASVAGQVEDQIALPLLQDASPVVRRSVLRSFSGATVKTPAQVGRLLDSALGDDQLEAHMAATALVREDWGTSYQGVLERVSAFLERNPGADAPTRILFSLLGIGA